ncbi:MAG: hypothetical protein AB7V50_04835 [Vampirovibrionia bacterium]
MNKTVQKQTVVKENKKATYNEIAISELKQEINVLEELSFRIIGKFTKWLESKTNITL